MSNSPKPRYERVGNSTQIYHAMQHFDAAWQSVAKGAAPPRLEAVLETISSSERPMFLRELLAIELECRAKQGESPRVADYLKRLPGDAETIQSVFAECGIGGRQEHSPPENSDENRGQSDKGSGTESTAGYKSLSPGTAIGSYTIIRLIGLGGMGAVYEAEHRRMRRKVALKMISPSALEHPEALQRFHREAQAMARLEHPNIVTAHDADQVGDINFLVMQYVDGDDLSTMVKNRGALPVDMALSFMVQTARGLEYAHQEGVIHRDIKPSNLIVGSNGLVKILDMGLARLEESLGEVSSVNKNLTQAGNIMGTVDFMAPEQALDAKEADQRADIYSLGCTFYYLLTGLKLYEGDTIMKRIMSHRFDPVPSLNDARQDIPEGLDAIFQKMVAKSRADRYRTMTELLAAVAPFVSAGLTGLDVAMPMPGHGTVSREMLVDRPATAVQVKSPTRPSAPIVATEKTSPSAAYDTQLKNHSVGMSVPAASANADRSVTASGQKSVASKSFLQRSGEHKANPETAVETEASALDESRRWNQKVSKESSSRLPAGGSQTKSSRLKRVVTLYCGLLLLVIAAAIFFLPRDNGTLMIHASAKVKKMLAASKGIRLRDATGQVHTLRPGSHDLAAGDYEIDYAKLPQGFKIVPENKHVGVERGKTVEITIELAAEDDKKPGADDVDSDQSPSGEK
jgi:serine/threonine protein kinase